MIARHKLLRFLHNWFERNSYIEINAPILTKLPLYDDKSAIELELHNQRLFLTQCVGYYLESAVQAFERVYNIGPSFRAEDSRSNRHLVEYWHVKLEACWLDRKKIMQHVEHLVRDIVDFARVELLELSGVLGTKIVPAIDMPFHQMTYKDAMSMISRHQEFKLGDHIGKNEERWLHISKPTWIIGNPRLSEPFPYRIDPDDGELTLTADLVLPDGYGELLGIAEKIYDPVELETRMHEKGRVVDSEFHWLVELRKSGMVPHSGMGMGMGLERLLRWLVQGGHVRDFSAFPRLYGRQYSP
jgi:asparaginyl-tRNA synthetase